ncbi:MAG: RNA 2',3'-cyclic phosphodiesterase [Candidatus Micrarchaeota archaeon]|nr:RNA 2',3'-cyclic phosphodiesterase [Candidatus Micrarchaeota archaeon]
MRAFIALDVPEQVRQRAEILERDFAIDGVTLVKKEAMHITLQFLGDIDAGQGEMVVEAMKGIRFRPFGVSLSGLSYFTPRMIRVIFVEAKKGGKELADLYGVLGKELKAKGIRFEEEKYTPHFTIARVKWAKDMRKLREAIEKNRGAELGAFDAKSVVLKESTLTPQGPVYRTLYEHKL